MTAEAFSDFMYDFENEDVKEKMFDLEDSTTVVDSEYQSKFVAFAMLTLSQVIEVQKLYEATGLDFKIEDVTTEALHGFYGTKDGAAIEMLASEWKMVEMVDKFVKECAEVDDVLDKISKFGMTSLTKVDHIVLKS